MEDARPSVVILGGGFAGVAVAQRLGAGAAVTVVSDENFLLFTPMLAEVAAADVEPRHIVAPLRQLCPEATVVIGEVAEVDVSTRTVTIRPAMSNKPLVLRADVLVLAAGSVPATFDVPGVEQWSVGFKTIADALRIRRRLLAFLEAATHDPDPRLTSVSIIGAGYSGSELAAGLADFLNTVVPRYYPAAPAPRVTLIDAVDRVTPSLPRRLSTAAAKGLERRGVMIALGAKCVEIGPEGVRLEDGSLIESGTVVWTAGVRASPLAADLGLDTDRDGRLLVDGHLQAAPGIFALGDMAAAGDGRGGVCPPTAQHALRLGWYLGRRLPDLLAGKKVPEFKYRRKGQLVSLGHRNAVGTVMGIKVSGILAWWLWRSYYLFRLPTILRKLRVAIDWSLDLFFPPDIAEIPSGDLGPLPDERRDSE